MDLNFVHGNKLVKEYVAGGAKKYFSTNKTKQRKGVNRQHFVEELLRYNRQFNIGKKGFENIDLLQQEDTLVVVSGQQAGLLTGPLYTVYKIATTIQYANEQSQLLGRKVIPVFWIAGEDHDYAEVNHVHVLEDNQIKKKSYGVEMKKKMISDVQIEQERLKSWIHEVFITFGETEHTKDVLEVVEECVDASQTFTEFMAHLVAALFKDTGLVLYDSGCKAFRALQIPLLKEIVEQNDRIAKGLTEIQQSLVEEGYHLTLQLKDEAAHLFYEIEEERCLVYREGENFIVGEGKRVFTKQELLYEIERNPQLFSNNVVTRPLMQQWLFPTLAFVGGPGEIAYWGELKKVFEVMELSMPIILPRLSLTILERNIATYLRKLEIGVEEVLEGKIENLRETYLTRHLSYSLQNEFEKLEKQISHGHRQLRERISNDFSGLNDFGERNQEILLRELNVYKQRLEKEQQKKHHVEMNQFIAISNHLVPLQSGQERVFNVFYYVNLYGFEFIEQLLSFHMPKTFQHKTMIM